MSRQLRIRRLAHAADLPLPRYETAGAACMDLVAANPSDAPLVIDPLARALVPTEDVRRRPDIHWAAFR